MNQKILNIFSSNQYEDIEDIFMLIICYLQQNIDHSNWFMLNTSSVDLKDYYFSLPAKILKNSFN